MPVAAGVLRDPGFDVSLEGAGGLMHEPDHADDEDGGGEHHPALEDVGVVLGAGQDDAPRRHWLRAPLRAPRRRSLQLRPADFGEVGKDDADDQRRFHTLAERDDKCLQHKVFLFPERAAFGWREGGPRLISARLKCILASHIQSNAD